MKNLINEIIFDYSEKQAYLTCSMCGMDYEYYFGGNRQRMAKQLDLMGWDGINGKLVCPDCVMKFDEEGK